jgi:hypothetical protein
MRRHTDTDHALHIIFHLHIEQGWSDRRILLNSIFHVEALASTPKVQSIVHCILKISPRRWKVCVSPSGSGRGSGD